MCNTTLPAALNPSRLLICVSGCKKTHTVRDTLLYASACKQAAQNWLAIFQGLASDFVDYRQCFEQMTVGKRQKRGTRCFRHHRMSSPYIVKLPVHVVRFTQKCISVLEACGVTEIQMLVYYYWLCVYTVMHWLYTCFTTLSSRQSPLMVNKKEERAESNSCGSL